MSDQSVTQDIQILFELTCNEQLQSLDGNSVQLDITGKEPVISNPYTACIQAASNDLTLTLLLHAPKSVLIGTLPRMAEIKPLGNSLLEDWTLELSNRIIGKLKNKLISYGCILKNGLPRFIEPIASQNFKHNGEEMALFFDINGETIECRLFVEIFNKAMSLALQEHELDNTEESELDFF